MGKESKGEAYLSFTISVAFLLLKQVHTALHFKFYFVFVIHELVQSISEIEP
jgi:hypothetical protein